MNLNNLHSLVGGRWFINESYGYSLLPSLYSILTGKIIASNSNVNPLLRPLQSGE